MHKFDAIPPESFSGEYTYSPMPAEYTPPIGKNLMKHWYDYPEEASAMQDCFGKVPKKLTAKVTACPTKGSSSGWGLCFTEGLSLMKVSCCCFLCLAISATFGIAWSVVRSDVQGGFGVACFMLASSATVVTLVQGMLEVQSKNTRA